MRHNNTRFGAYLYSAGTQHENLLKSIDYEQNDLFHFRRLTRETDSVKTMKCRERISKKMKVNGPGRRTLGQGRNFWHRLSIHGYILTSVRLKKNIRQLWGFNRVDIDISASAVRNEKHKFKTERNGKLQHIKLVYTLKLSLEMAFFVIINELLRDKVIAIWNSG